MSKETKGLVLSILLLFAVIAIICGIIALFSVASNAQGKNEFEKEISGYTTIVVNGEEYKIDNITNIEYDDSLYENDTMVIELDDGTRVRFLAGCYTLKGKK